MTYPKTIIALDYRVSREGIIAIAVLGSTELKYVNNQNR